MKFIVGPIVYKDVYMINYFNLFYENIMYIIA